MADHGDEILTGPSSRTQSGVGKQVHAPGARVPLSAVVPPLFCGTATFTSQYNVDPFALPTTEIIHRALALGVRGFDTSPYYGPAEDLVGRALDTDHVRDRFSRDDYVLSTKVGRIATDVFDYSAHWVRSSVQRSLQRLRTDYLDLVYCHDVEFVSPSEVLEAVTELRRIRDETGTVRYIGISGYPVHVLGELAELVLNKTGEPLDAVMSYANFTLQNTTLRSAGVPRLKAAGVAVVLNGSPLGMGLLRRNGVPVGSRGDFHPAPSGLREACSHAADVCAEHGQTLDTLAIRFALGEWSVEGKEVGSRRKMRMGGDGLRDTPLGVSVIGASSVAELEQNTAIWLRVSGSPDEGQRSKTEVDERLEAEPGQKSYRDLYADVRSALGHWADYAWPSPGADFRPANAPPGAASTEGHLPGKVDDATADRHTS